MKLSLTILAVGFLPVSWFVVYRIGYDNGFAASSARVVVKEVIREVIKLKDRPREPPKIVVFDIPKTAPTGKIMVYIDNGGYGIDTPLGWPRPEPLFRYPTPEEFAHFGVPESERK